MTVYNDRVPLGFWKIFLIKWQFFTDERKFSVFKNVEGCISRNTQRILMKSNFFIYRKLIYFLAVPFLQSLETVLIKENNISRNCHFWAIFWRGWRWSPEKKNFFLWAVILVLMICDVSRPVSLVIWTYEPVSQVPRKGQICVF